ncbi:hypothetical protein GCM10023224_06630 [Streptomonospora halophila]|uniref:Uncharacterized protein n=1 Tax=Streptomonospora halophila TaxID=427369 RepID=A0ABP9G6B6_9ACTN
MTKYSTAAVTKARAPIPISLETRSASVPMAESKRAPTAASPKTSPVSIRKPPKTKAQMRAAITAPGWPDFSGRGA